MTWLHLVSFGKTCHASFATDARALLSHRTFHQQHHGHKHERHRGRQQKDIEISQRGCLLLAQILECLPGELLRSNRIAGLLQEHSPSLLEERSYSRVERIEGLAEPQGVKLVTALLQRLRHGRPDAASLVAQQTQQADSRSAQQRWSIEVGRYIRGGKAYGKSNDQHHPRPDDLARADLQVQL